MTDRTKDRGWVLLGGATQGFRLQEKTRTVDMKVVQMFDFWAQSVGLAGSDKPAHRMISSKPLISDQSF
jgi:hypothetical protein